MSPTRSLPLAMRAVIDCHDPQLVWPARIVLQMIAWHADAGDAPPDPDTLAVEAAVSGRTVRNAIATLQRLGYLQVTPGQDEPGGYRILVEALTPKPHHRPAGGA